MNDERVVLKGYIGRKFFDDAKTYNTGYKVYAFHPNNDCQHLVELNQYGSITINGKMPDLIEAKEYTVTCILDTKSKYPNSYKLVNITCDREESISVNETTSFLSKLALKQSVIENIIEKYPNIIELIINDRVNEIDISQIKGIGVKKLNKIVEKVNENYRFFDIMTEYSDMGLTMKMVQALYDKYTNIEMIRKAMDINPYECLCSIARVGFKTADSRIIAKNESLKYSEFRMKECIRYLVQENQLKGNTWINIAELHNQAMNTTPECIRYFAMVLKEDEKIYFNPETKRVGFKKAYVCEFEIAHRIYQLLSHKKNYNFDVSKYTKSRDGFDLSNKQQEILPLLKEHGVCILMGYAGTGKSTSLKAVVDMLDDNGKSVMLLAPTGRASKVLANMTEKEASTIHRGLKLGAKKLELNSNNPIKEQFVVCDESSMIDIWLMRSLLRAINPQTTTLVFVCDPAQLASVGCGNVISDIIQSEVVPTVFLDEVFRYGEGGLSYVATEIREGRKYLDPLTTTSKITNFGKNNDYSFIKCDKEETLGMLMNLYPKLIRSGMSVHDVTILSAYNKGELGTYNLNNVIQNIVNPSIEEDIFTKEIDGITIAFREGDRVIQINNNYKANIYIEDRSSLEEMEERPTTKIFNGDDGVVKFITDDLLVVDFYGELVEYEKKDLKDLLLGYAISVHKSQGSTFDNAVVVTPISHKFFTKRNLLYVAMTRARKRVFHIGDIGTINYALKQSENILRNTFLYDLLKVSDLESYRIEYKENDDSQENTNEDTY